MIQFVSAMVTGKVHAAVLGDDGKFKSLCSKLHMEDPMIWFKKNHATVADEWYWANPTTIIIPKSCGFKSCKTFIQAAGNVAQNTQTMEA